MEDRTQEQLAGSAVAYDPEEPVTPAPTIPKLDPGRLAFLDECRRTLTKDGADPRRAFLGMLATRESLETARAALRELMIISHGSSYFAGWWHDPVTGEVVGSVAEKIALIHSEASEMLEADRKGLMDDKLPSRPGIEVEMADLLHRLLDLAGALNVDLPGAYVEKCLYNAGRADHAVENRAKAGGKAY